MSPSPRHFVLVDALNLIRRIHGARPEDEGPERAEATRTTSVQSLRRALRENDPSHAVCVFDGDGPSWRHGAHPGYKAERPPMPVDLAGVLGTIRSDFASELGIVSLDRPGIEADDVVATLAAKAASAGVPTTILSTDRIFLQLLPLGVRVRDHFGGEDFGVDAAQRRFGVPPDRIVEALALAGDSGNGIPGLAGVGKKTAAKLLERFGTLDRVLDECGSVDGRLGERLRAGVETVRLSRRLATLRTDLDLGTSLRDLRVGQVPT